MAYVYTDQTLQSEHWPEPTLAAVLWERAKHWASNLRRAPDTLTRML